MKIQQVWPKIIALVWAISVGVVCYDSLIPQLELPVEFWNADKVYHLFAYAWLALLPMVGFRNRKVALVAACSMMILGIILEIAQTHIPGRTFSFLDMAANGLGVLAGTFFGHSVRPKFRNVLLPARGDQAIDTGLPE